VSDPNNPLAQDLYASYYTERLWNLLPEVYRASDSDTLGGTGPLRELIKRLGAQIAVSRRTIDRTLEDQSIESCDDWLIPYQGDLLATNLVAGLDSRGQRLDVAKTIYYRRRKGTLAILEEIAADITGWNARVVEFFRRLTRARHQFDPAIGEDRNAAVIEGLLGALSGTPIGGFADLRNVDAAASLRNDDFAVFLSDADAAKFNDTADSGVVRAAFDEFSHTADFRRGRTALGWHNISKLGIFLYRLRSYRVEAATPVQSIKCPGQYTFDPTGRENALFAIGRNDHSQYGDAWVTPDEWMLPTPISDPLLKAELAHLYPTSLALLSISGPANNRVTDVVDPANALLYPERGRFTLLNALPAGDDLCTTYTYGFSSEIGAGPFDRRVHSEALPDAPAPEVIVSGGGTGFQTALQALQPTGTVTLKDSLTYTAVANVKNISNVLLRASNSVRPVARTDAANPWVLQGAGGDAAVTLEGLFLSGPDLVLQGKFNTVTLLCCTLDPGEELDDAGKTPQSLDERDLLPTTLWIEGTIGTLVIERSICGPIRTRNNGALQTLQITDSIVQSVQTVAPGDFTTASVMDVRTLALQLKSGQDPLTQFVLAGFDAAQKQAVADYDPTKDLTVAQANALTAALLAGLNAVINGPAVYSPARFAPIPLPPALLAAATAIPAPTGAALVALNRELLEAAWPVMLDEAAIVCAETRLSLLRSTVLGRTYAHRISASDSILSGFASADDAQSGCIRFSAYVSGSRLHQLYESAETRENAALFVSRRFGDAAYAQLSLTADREVVPSASAVKGDPLPSIRSFAEDGSEMGAFSREKNPIKERGLRTKLSEFTPIGLTPVLIYST
jgi:hypothetical protein